MTALPGAGAVVVPPVPELPELPLPEVVLPGVLGVAQVWGSLELQAGASCCANGSLLAKRLKDAS